MISAADPNSKITHFCWRKVQDQAKKRKKIIIVQVLEALKLLGPARYNREKVRMSETKQKQYFSGV